MVQWLTTVVPERLPGDGRAREVVRRIREDGEPGTRWEPFWSRAAFAKLRPELEAYLTRYGLLADPAGPGPVDASPAADRLSLGERYLLAEDGNVVFHVISNAAAESEYRALDLARADPAGAGRERAIAAILDGLAGDALSFRRAGADAAGAQALLDGVHARAMEAADRLVALGAPADTVTITRALGENRRVLRPDAELLRMVFDLGPPVADTDDDPDLHGEGAVRHAMLQNQLAGRVALTGLEPLSSGGRAPATDLTFRGRDGVLRLVEVKSITADNSPGQTRRALGQLLDYGTAVTERDPAEPAPVLVAYLERDPGDHYRAVARMLGVEVVTAEREDEVERVLTGATAVPAAEQAPPQALEAEAEADPGARLFAPVSIGPAVTLGAGGIGLDLGPGREQP